MQSPLRITFRDMPVSPAVEARIRERAAALEQHNSRLTSCHVVVEARHRHHRQGRLYRISVHIAVPEGEVTISRDPDEHRAHEDVYVALRDAFGAAERRLRDRAQRLRGAA